MSRPSKSTVVAPGAQRLEVALLLGRPGSGRLQHRTELGPGHDDHAVDVPHHPVPRPDRHPGHDDRQAGRAALVLGRPREGHGGGEHREPVLLQGADVSDPTVDDQADQRPGFRRGGQHLTPVAPIGDGADIDHQGRTDRSPGHPDVDGQVVAGSAAHREGRGGQPGAGPHRFDPGRQGPGTALAQGGRAERDQLGGHGLRLPVLARSGVVRPAHGRARPSGTATAISISTAPPRGRAATPRADRLWRPAGPKTSKRSVLAPSTTAGCWWKAGSEAT